MTTTVADLMESLSELPPETPIVLSSDAEGNHYGYLYNWEYGEAFYESRYGDTLEGTFLCLYPE